jgi:hypothetical protein
MNKMTRDDHGPRIDIQPPEKALRAVEQKVRDSYQTGWFAGLGIGLFLGVLIGWWLFGEKK